MRQIPSVRGSRAVEAVAIMPARPTGACAGQQARRRRRVLYVATLPLSVVVLVAVGHPGVDLLHAIKPGWGIAPLGYALGWPLARRPGERP